MSRIFAALFGRLPIGWLQLTHNRSRLAAALAGVAFANVLVFVQLGIKGSLDRAVVAPYDFFSAAAMISAEDATTFTDGGNVPRAAMLKALADPQVTDAAPLFVGMAGWKHDGRETLLMTIGLPPGRADFLTGDLPAKVAGLTVADTAVIDRETRDLDPDTVAAIRPHSPLRFEAQGRTLSVPETFEGGVGFSADGYLFVSDQTFLSLFPRRSAAAPDHVLLRLARGADPGAVTARLADQMPQPGLRVRPLETAAQEDLAYQTTERPTGLIFGFGVVMGVLVGIIIVYQVLATDVADHLAEYATFKAMGYSQGFILGIVFEEALILAVLGFVPGFAIASAALSGLKSATGLPVEMTPDMAAAVFFGTLAACAISGAIATRKLAAADPADLF